MEIVDRIRDLGLHGVAGNTDEMLFRPESLTEFANQSPGMQPLLAAIEEMAAVTREALGEERLAWLRGLLRTQIHAGIALVHANPESPVARTHAGRSRRRVGVDLRTARPAGRHLCAYPSVDSTPSIRRVEYDVDRELKALSTCSLPHAAWVARIIETAVPKCRKGTCPRVQ